MRCRTSRRKKNNRKQNQIRRKPSLPRGKRNATERTNPRRRKKTAETKPGPHPRKKNEGRKTSLHPRKKNARVKTSPFPGMRDAENPRSSATGRMKNAGRMPVRRRSSAIYRKDDRVRHNGPTALATTRARGRAPSANIAQEAGSPNIAAGANAAA